MYIKNWKYIRNWIYIKNWNTNIINTQLRFLIKFGTNDLSTIAISIKFDQRIHERVRYLDKRKMRFVLWSSFNTWFWLTCSLSNLSYMRCVTSRTGDFAIWNPVISSSQLFSSSLRFLFEKFENWPGWSGWFWCYFQFLWCIICIRYGADCL